MGTNFFTRPLKSKTVFLPGLPSIEVYMKQYIPSPFMVLLILAATACAPVSPATEQNFPTETAEPYYPLTTKTGLRIVDQVLQGVANGDAETLRALVEYTNAECTQQDGLGGPPKCREGEVEGTPVEVLAFLGSEGGHLRKDEMENWSGIKATGVYAVYEVNAAAISSEEYYPVGKYVILFVDEENKAAIALRIGERGIVRIDDIIDSSPPNLRAMIEREASTVLLQPIS